ncbi:MAG: CAP domain-containing protein, partial [Halothiobacillaceae bacterium]
WSDRGPWRPCCYRDNDPASSRCMRAKPAQITGGRYSGPGYEILAYQSRDMDAQTALTLWRQSPRHHEVILNRGPWSDHHWRALGGALSDRHAILWFGAQPDPDH